jgi:outer membrane protein OmpA-like peptidoglycan-associated protein
MNIFLLTLSAFAEPSSVDARGYWVADTITQLHRSPRILYPTAPVGYDIGLMMDYADQPLIEALPGEDIPIVQGMFSQHLYGGTSLSGVRIDASLPMTSYAVDVGGPYSALGDLRLGVMLPLLDIEEGWPGMALQVVSWLPTGNEARWSGSVDPATGAVLSIAQDLTKNWGWAANAGARISSGYPIRNTQSGSGYIAGVELHHQLKDNIVLGLEGVSQGASGFQNVPLELGARMRFEPQTRPGQMVTFGLSKGVLDGVGSSAFRIQLGLSYSPRKPKEIELTPIVVPVFLYQDNWKGPTQVQLAELVDDQILIREPIFFMEGQSQILEDSSRVLQDVVDILNENLELEIIIEGHTNERGTPRYNQSLSAARANEVMKWFIKEGIDPNRLESRGLGESYSIVKRFHPDSMVYNRRVEFRVRSSIPEPDAMPSELRGEISAKRTENETSKGSESPESTPSETSSDPTTEDPRNGGEETENNQTESVEPLAQPPEDSQAPPPENPNQKNEND